MTSISQHTQKEAIAEQIVRFVRLIPTAPGGIIITDFQESPAHLLYEQKTQDLYFRIFDLAYSIYSRRQVSDEETITAAVDIVELVRDKLSGKA